MLVCGIGINDVDYKVNVNGVSIPSYRAWIGMMNRVYNQNQQCYVGCEVHPDWHRFSVFADWYNPRYREGYSLDKDALIKGNRVYGPDTCVVVPAWINNMLIGQWNKGELRNGLMRGVVSNTTKKWGTKYIPRDIPFKGDSLRFDNQETAHYCWIHTKRMKLRDNKELIDSIDERLYDALLSHFEYEKYPTE